MATKNIVPRADAEGGIGTALKRWLNVFISGVLSDGTNTATVANLKSAVDLKHSNSLDHSNANDPSADQKAALAGTSGTPSSSNKFVTNADARNSDARTALAHGHAESDVTNLVSDLAEKTTLTAVKADADISDAITKKHSNENDPSAGEKAALVGTSGTPGSGNKFVTDADARNTNSRTPTTHTHPESEVTNLVTDLAAKEATANKGAASGYAPLDAGSKVLTVNLGGSGAGASNYLCGDQTWKTPSTGGGGNADFNYYRKYGVTNYEIWYAAGATTGIAMTTGALTTNRLYAVPFISPKAITLDRIGINVTTLGSGASARLGIYVDNGNLYPGSLLLDAGTVDMSTTGVKTITISQALSANTLYWLVLVCNVAATIRAIAATGMVTVLGVSSGLGTAWNTHLYVSFTYASLPSTFPSSPTVATAATPGIFVRLNA
jgi:hypothetical protein